MIAIDTNILVRLFVDEPSAQKQINLVKNLLKNETHIYISQMVQIELIWVLESSYDFNKEQVIIVLDILNNNDNFILEKANHFETALNLFKNGTADFSDYLIFANANHHNYPFWTFDKKLSKTQGVNHLT